MITIQKATRELRDHLGMSQQAMASYLGLSMAALRNYESGAVKRPSARAAATYMLVSETNERPDLAEVFGDALRRGLGITEQIQVLPFIYSVSRWRKRLSSVVGMPSGRDRT